MCGILAANRGFVVEAAGQYENLFESESRRQQQQ
jgi:hypothetical protein